MGELTQFLTDALTLDADISIKAKIYILVSVIIFFSIITYIIRNKVELYVLKKGYTWYVLIALFNLICMTVVLYYYMNKKDNMIGDIGKRGHNGNRGERGKFTTCSFCKWNIYAQKTKNYQQVVAFVNMQKTDNWGDTMATRLSSDLEKNYSKLDEFILNSDDISSSSLMEMYKPVINFFGIVMSITLSMLYMTTSQLNMALDGENRPGSIYRASGKKGYFPLGDTPFLKDIPTKLNGFVMSGDIRHPVKYEKLNHSTSYYQDPYATDENFNPIVEEEYTLWRPVPPEGYVVLSDIVQFGTGSPDVNTIVCLKESCVKQIPIDDLEFMYIHFGYDIPKNMLDGVIKGQNENTSVVEKTVKHMNYFSVWRTPLNNVIFNVVKDTDFTDNTLIHNIVGNRQDYIDKEGEISKGAYKIITKRLKQIELDKPLVGLYIAIYFHTYYLREAKTYIMRNVKHIEKIKNEHNKKKQVDRIFKRLFMDKMENVPAIIEKTKTMFDLMLVLFPDGYHTHIVPDNSVVANMGNPLLQIQSNLLKVLKCVFPPNTEVYIVKNDCLSYMKIDEDRQYLIKKVNNTIKINKKLVKMISADPDKYCESAEAVMLRISQKDDRLFEYLSHITNFQYKLDNGDYDDFTNERLETIQGIYEGLNQYLNLNCSVE